MKLSVISPTCNEAENVERFVQEASRAFGSLDYEILALGVFPGTAFVS